MVLGRGHGSAQVRTTDGEVVDVSLASPLATEDATGLLGVIAETLERIQQQLAKMVDEGNLRPGERHYE